MMEKPAKLRGHLLYLAEIGGSPDDILAGTGISFETVNMLTPLPVAQIATLFDVLAQRTPDDFAIRCGRATRPQYMGVLGYRLRNCSTIRELLETWNRYSIVIGYPLESTLVARDDRWDLEFRPRYPLTSRALRFCMETTMSGSVPAIHAMSGHNIEPISYGFPFPAPDSLDRYAPLTPASLIFNKDAGFISGWASDIDLPITAIDVEARTLCDDYCKHALARINRSEKTSEKLRTIFAGSPGQLPTAREAAASLNVSVRTLQRQLIDEGINYQQLVEAFRHARACSLLEDGIETKTIAYLLGFKDSGSFSRAFRQWTGSAPTQWRRETMVKSRSVGQMQTLATSHSTVFSAALAGAG